MRCIRSLFILFGLLYVTQHAIAREGKATRILVVLDGSFSMSQDWNNGQTKFKTASDFILRLMDTAYTYDSTIEFALRVYGHQYPSRYRQCYDSKNEVFFSRDNKQQMLIRLENIQPKGVASISYSVRESVHNINFKDRYEYILVMITDGGESCEGNFCESLDVLKRYAPVTTHVLHLADVTETRLSCANFYYKAVDKSIEQHAIQNILQNSILGAPTVTQPPVIVEQLNTNMQRPIVNTNPVVRIPPPTTVTPPPMVIQQPAEEAITLTATQSADMLGFGVLSLTGLDSVEIKDLQIEDAGRYIHYEKYNSGMQPQGPKMVHKLPPGNYKVLYRKGVDQIWQKFFTIKDGQITEVKL